MTRLQALEIISSEWHGKRLATRLKENEFDSVVEFIEENDQLLHLEFEYAVNRMFLMNENKPKHWTIIQELLMMANTRAKGMKR